MSNPLATPSVKLSDATSVVPPEAPAVKTLSKLGVGTELAKWVLAIAGGSIVSLLLYLSIMDARESKSVDAVVSRAMEAATSNSNSAATQNANELWQLFALATAVPTATFTPQEIQTAKISVSNLAKAGTIESAQSNSLYSCMAELSAPPPHSDTEKLANCNSTAAALLAKVSAEDLDRLRLLRDFAKDAQDHHQALRSFWLQAAQLILLNLLLPVLTALLGYMFGTHEAGKQQS